MALLGKRLVLFGLLFVAVMVTVVGYFRNSSRVVGYLAGEGDSVAQAKQLQQQDSAAVDSPPAVNEGTADAEGGSSEVVPVPPAPAAVVVDKIVVATTNATAMDANGTDQNDSAGETAEEEAASPSSSSMIRQDLDIKVPKEQQRGGNLESEWKDEKFTPAKASNEENETSSKVHQAFAPHGTPTVNRTKKIERKNTTLSLRRGDTNPVGRKPSKATNASSVTTKASNSPSEKTTTENPAKKLGFGACCGIGHRMSYILPTLVYARTRGMVSYGVWPDVPWTEIFNETSSIRQGTGRFKEEWYSNTTPMQWKANTTSEQRPNPRQGSVISRYHAANRHLFHMEEAQALVQDLRNSLSARVLRKLNPILEKHRARKLRFGAHFRFGNNETGDWARKAWRHVDSPESIMNGTLRAMLVAAGDEPSVSVLVASDTAEAAKWLRGHIPDTWQVISQDDDDDNDDEDNSTGNNTTKPLKPSSGVWFGEWGSNTSSVLSKEDKYERMAEGFADVFALGEGDALFIPTYSSFTIIPIVLTYAHSRPVYFRAGLDFFDDNNTLLSFPSPP